MTTFSTPQEIDTYVVIVLKNGLKLYGRTGMKPNRHWSVSNMLRKATEFTGATYKNSKAECLRAAEDLQRLLDWENSRG